jgi:hypothetical protein
MSQREERACGDWDGAVARFTAIVIQDGSSFAVKPALTETFPGRFTMIEPAVAEVHATYSGSPDAGLRPSGWRSQGRTIASGLHWPAKILRPA